MSAKDGERSVEDQELAEDELDAVTGGMSPGGGPSRPQSTGSSSLGGQSSSTGGQPGGSGGDGPQIQRIGPRPV